MEINLLDMGNTQYGDCIVVTHNNKRILIDGAHPGDADLIKTQIGQVLNDTLPFTFDLLIVTHCHSDHIGCLPRLVKNGVLKFKVALVADEKLGFARDENGEGPADAVFTLSQKGLINALMEEDQSNLTDSDLAAFIADAASLESNYKFMLKQLATNGTKVIRYRGLENTTGLASLEEAFNEVGLKIIGPTEEHLLLCASSLGIQADSNAANIFQTVQDDSTEDKLAKKYKEMTQKASDDGAEDMVGPGAAKNNQSIVLKLEADGWRALLGGDMQFAKSEVKELNPIMAQLLSKVNEEGPYEFIKLTHHTAANGINEPILDQWLLNTNLFAHTGGLSDPKHPDPNALKMFKAKKDSLTLARTDRNGIITVRKSDRVVKMEISKGDFNNFSENKRLIEDPIRLAENIAYPIQKQAPKQPTPQIKVLGQNEPFAASFVEVSAKIPHTDTKVIITVEVEPGQKKNQGIEDLIRLELPPDEKYRNLIFVTCSAKLGKNIGDENARLLIDSITRMPGVQLIDLSSEIHTAIDASRNVTPYLSSSIKGVVIIGGYDVVPSCALDVLDAGTRSQMERAGKLGNDGDDFIVWNDDLYGDANGDSLPEIPVSRIPDGSSAELVLNAFKVKPYQPGSKFGIRNLARPFANLIYGLVPGTANEIQISAKYSPTDIQTNSLSGAVYLMLHGSDVDGTRLWGETVTNNSYEALNINNVSTSAPGTIIFTGACWAALTVESLAYTAASRTGVVSRSIKNSIALTFLANGAMAFVGCTGSHYSPLTENFNFYGKPLHDEFWCGIGKNLSPAKALLEAKKKYLLEMPHGRNDLVSKAIELKILREFTCLGIGW